jgi:two-component system, OmpR family, alkaline phosphatase synthesis response regulator PhoP
MPKIIVAEDDKLISGSLVQAFKDAGFEVIPAYDGEEAVAKLKEHKPEAMVLDIMMPKLDGIGVLWEMKADPDLAGTSVVMLTNMSDADTISKIMEAGGTDYLLKSDQSIDQVVEKVKEVMAR